MEIKAKCTLHNKFDIVVRDAITKEVIQEGKAENIVLDRIYTRLLTFGSYFDQIVFGSGTGIPTPSRTTLFARIGSKAAVTEQLIRAYPTSVWTKKITLGVDEFNGNIIREIGISETTTNINTHALITDAEGNPLEIEKNNLRIIDIYATVYVNLYDVDSGLYFNGDGWRTYMTGGGAPGAVLGIAFLNDTTTKTGTLTTINNSGERSVKCSTRFGVADLNKEVKYIDWVSLGLRCEMPRLRVWEGIQKNAVELGSGDGIKTIFSIPQKFIEDIVIYVDGALNVGWSLNSFGEIVFNIPPGYGLKVTADYYCKLIPKDVNHVLDVDYKIYYAVAEPAPVVPAPTFPDLPGSEVPVAGDLTYGFFGEVPGTDLITFEDLCTQIGLTAGTAQNLTEPWLKFVRDNRILFGAKKTIRYNVSWDNINAAGAVFGDKLMTIGNAVYAVRLLTTQEWDALIQPVHKDGIAPRWGTYDNVQLNITGNGGYTWTSTPSGSLRVMRGSKSVGYSHTDPPSSANSYNGFRPVLEFLYTLPSGV